MERIIIDKGYSVHYCPLSEEAIKLYAERSEFLSAEMIKYNWNDITSYARWDPILIEIIEELGSRANVDCYTCLVVVDVPDEYWGEIETVGGHECVKFHWKEDHLRELIRLGNEDDIVNYVRGKLV